MISASYGPACGNAQGNVTQIVAAQCIGLETPCDILVDNSVFGDPFLFCSKDFEVIWVCGSDPTQNKAYHPAVMDEDYVVSISCEQP